MCGFGNRPKGRNNFKVADVERIERTCCHCGRPFWAADKKNTCPQCRGAGPVLVPVAPLPKLSFRQEQIVRLVALGLRNKEFAYELRLTEGTIKEYVHHTFRKLGVKSRTELVRYAIETLETKAA